MVAIVFKQIITMTIFMVIGYCMFKMKLITVEGTKSIGNIMVMVVIPCIILNSFFIELTPEKLREYGWCFLVATVTQVLAVIIGALIYRKNAEDNLCIAFGNIAFMGIPLITAALGQKAVFYISPYIMVFNLIQWNYGVPLLKGEKVKFNLKSVLWNPYTVASILGFLIFILKLGTKVPVIISAATSQISAINGPLAMILLGTYIAQAGVTKIFIKYKYYEVSFVRLIVTPLITMFLFRFIPCAREIKLAIGIGSCAPVATSLAIYSKLYGRTDSHASLTIALSTIFSVVTIPLMIYLSDFLF